MKVRYKKLALLITLLFAVACSSQNTVPNVDIPVQDTNRVIYSLSSIQDTYKVGDVISIDVSVDTNDVSILSGLVKFSYNPLVLGITENDISEAGSIFSMWLPHTIESGNITLRFGEPTPGVNTTVPKKIATLEAKALKPGTTTLSLVKEDLIAQDKTIENIVN